MKKQRQKGPPNQEGAPNKRRPNGVDQEKESRLSSTAQPCSLSHRGGHSFSGRDLLWVLPGKSALAVRSQHPQVRSPPESSIREHSPFAPACVRARVREQASASLSCAHRWASASLPAYLPCSRVRPSGRFLRGPRTAVCLAAMAAVTAARARPSTNVMSWGRVSVSLRNLLLDMLTDLSAPAVLR